MSFDAGEWLRAYGLWAIVFGTFLEGESILLAGVWAARRGYLSLPAVLGCAVFGAFASDQLYFWLGRTLGTAKLSRSPRWVRSRDKISAALARHQNAFVLTFRFLYGLRTVVPLVLGASGVSAARFLLLDALAVCAWAGTFAFGGLAASHAGAAVGALAPGAHAGVVAVAVLSPVSLAGLVMLLARRWRRRP